MTELLVPKMIDLEAAVSLERTVRPFQLPAVTPPALVLDEHQAERPGRGVAWAGRRKDLRLLLLLLRFGAFGDRQLQGSLAQVRDQADREPRGSRNSSSKSAAPPRSSSSTRTIRGSSGDTASAIPTATAPEHGSCSRSTSAGIGRSSMLAGEGAITSSSTRKPNTRRARLGRAPARSS